MSDQRYRERLLALDKELSARATRAQQAAREQVPDFATDIGDASVIDEGESEAFAEAELDGSVLQQIRDALGRIRDGTYGQCVVDGGPIEQQRLEAVPWTPYCLKHQTELETASRRKMPTL